MRPIRIHLKNEGVSVVDTPAHAIDVRGGKPRLRGAMKDMETILALASVVDPLPRSVWRRIVDDQHVRTRHVRPDIAQNRRQGRHLVVRWNDDQGVVAGRRRRGRNGFSHDSHLAESSGRTHVWRALMP